VTNDRILLLTLVYVVVVSATIESVCNLDTVPCGKTGDSTRWLLQLISIIVSLLVGTRGKNG
jgi:hypothetical protein